MIKKIHLTQNKICYKSKNCKLQYFNCDPLNIELLIRIQMLRSLVLFIPNFVFLFSVSLDEILDLRAYSGTGKDR